MKPIFVIEHEEIYQGYHLVITFNRAWRCGYVGLPLGHKLQGKEYNDLNYEVHGGLTYSSNTAPFIKDGFGWYLGFDCAHWDDGMDIETMKQYGASQEVINIWQHLDGEVRTKEYVLQELKNLVEQICEVKQL